MKSAAEAISSRSNQQRIETGEGNTKSRKNDDYG